MNIRPALVQLAAVALILGIVLPTNAFADGTMIDVPTISNGGGFNCLTFCQKPSSSLIPAPQLARLQSNFYGERVAASTSITSILRAWINDNGPNTYCSLAQAQILLSNLAANSAIESGRRLNAIGAALQTYVDSLYPYEATGPQDQILGDEDDQHALTGPAWIGGDDPINRNIAAACVFARYQTVGCDINSVRCETNEPNTFRPRYECGVYARNCTGCSYGERSARQGCQCPDGYSAVATTFPQSWNRNPTICWFDNHVTAPSELDTDADSSSSPSVQDTPLATPVDSATAFGTEGAIPVDVNVDGS
jgi:hypothetical protein